MANILKKQYKEFPAGTTVKVHNLEVGIATISIPPFNKKYMVAASILTKGAASHSEQDVQQMWLQTHTVSPGRPTIPAKDWSKLDAMPITYPGTNTTDWPIRFECYCGKSFAYYRRNDVATQPLERMALDKVIADCTHCSEKHSTASQRAE